MRNKFIYFLLFISLIFVAACSSNDGTEQAVEENTEQNETDEEVMTEENDEEDVSEVDSNVADEQDDEADSEATTEHSQSTSNENKGLPDPIEINDRVQTDTGLVFEVERITFEDDHIAVDFNADNMSGFKKRLASKGAARNDRLGGITLQDDTGFDYRYVANKDDARIVIEDQEKVEGTVRFLGRIEEDAKTLTLTFNPDRDEDDSSAPKFTYENIEINW